MVYKMSMVCKSLKDAKKEAKEYKNNMIIAGQWNEGVDSIEVYYRVLGIKFKYTLE